MSVASRSARAGTPGLARALRAWASQHLQCAVSSLGSLWRAPLGTALTTGVIGIGLLLPFSLYLVVEGVSEASSGFGGTFNISVFLHPELDDEAGAALAGELRARDDIAAVTVIDKRTALEEFRAAVDVEAGLTALDGQNPLPVVLVVTPSSQATATLPSVAQALRTRPEVEFVQAERDWLLRLEAMLALARRVLWLLSGLLAGGVMLVVVNTLRLTIEARRAEVEIAKLFGASDAFVRRPFLYQGFLYGAGGAIVAGGLTVVGTALLAAPVERLGALYSSSLQMAAPSPIHLLALLGCGAGLGLAAAWLWVGRHLRSVQPR